ncbi:DNA topoisomerase [Solimonas fluminis]|uniref:DNA topoisomerase n=1 Tax=Solimonas fluminis TaxID=2086571 RepID=A0A2S5TH21_9GAMM|nr:DNA topoisomerase IB [Solimonas fluminis]PPE74237.1 DNA topoisomerase [Solimonas fluminis]
MPRTPLTPEQLAARAAGLRYVDDAGPGIRRRRLRGGFAYDGPDGRRVRDAATLERIRRLAVPPAYTDVWICADAAGHLQASGRDARGRKQYRYHPDWRAVRDADKYGRLLQFGQGLPRLRRRIAADLRRPGLPREKVLAAVLRLMEKTLIRVGNVEYARSNGSYGLTTLRNRHVEVSGPRIRFEFRGKSGVRHASSIEDPRLARLLRRCMELPGQELFQYVDEAGERRPVGSADVNSYLRQIAGSEFTAKDYRTWAGSVLALETLRAEAGPPTRARLADMFRQVAKRLGNTPAVCRKCYVHPAVISSYLEGGLPSPPPGRRPVGEAALLALLRRRRRSRNPV